MDLEAILDVMGCKTRREILYLLTQEPRFVSQISRELEIGQKAIIEHLRAMEELGLLNSSFQKIERGRPRKYYGISQNMEINIFIGPDSIKMNVIGEEFSQLHQIEEKLRMGNEDIIEDLEMLIEKYDKAKKYAENLLIEVKKRNNHHL
ncbi:MAG: ArsR family transcriptional regulator [Methanobacterium sp.]|uniref:ArsR/SmtB family transcription factor n=1 Tax=Methanobacterium sp. TaxID=2164 RepID=UPI003D6589BE|nr:ArsR family transcriptional regulator [Methanobacterium sp.]